MTTLALDLGTKTGFALRIDDSGSTVSGTWDFTTLRHEDAGMRFVRFREALQRMRVNNGVTKIYFEEVRRHAGTTAAHIYGGLVAILKAFCVENEVSYESVPVGTIKKSWTGNGSASKEQMVETAFRRGFEPSDHNEADAIALLCLKCGDCA